MVARTGTLQWNLESAIKASGKSKREVAKEIGVSYNYLWRILAGQRRLRADILGKIAISTNKSPNELYGDLLLDAVF